MQLPEKVREVAVSGIAASTRFEISFKDSAHIKAILRDNIYTDRILAVLREYSANAWDAHRMAGKPELPIKVVIPTWDNPVLLIQDFGPGLSHEDVFEVFTQYGASTKRGTNEAVGMLGIGCKSGFAYSDTFTVVSRHGGKKRTYVALLDESDNDAMSLLAEEDCGEETGITIQIAIKREDIYAFQDKAKTLFQHFVPRPDINVDLPPVPAIRSKLKHGIIYDRILNNWDRGEWHALMGCVPYKIDLEQLKGPQGEALVSEAFKKTCGLMQFDIGEIQISASREGLKYSKMTKDALVAKFESLLEEFLRVALDEIENGTDTNWAKRVRAQIVLKLGLGRAEIGEWGRDWIRFADGDKPKTFDFGHNGSLKVGESTRLVRWIGLTKEQEKYPAGFHLETADYTITPRTMTDGQDPPQPVPGPDGKPQVYSWDAVDAELAEIVVKHRLEGITIVDASTLAWCPKASSARADARRTGPVDVKHRVRVFVRNDRGYHCRPLSRNWDVVTRVAQADDVFVVVDKFEPTYSRFDRERAEDERIAEAFGVKLPPIYGYKTLSKKPVDIAKTTGVHYPVWRKAWLAGLMTGPGSDRIRSLLQDQAWRQQTNDVLGTHTAEVTGRLKNLRRELGCSHPVITCIVQMLRVRASLPAESYETSRMLNQLGNAGVLTTAYWTAAETFVNGMSLYPEIAKTYPLLGEECFRRLWYRNTQPWIHYIKLVDRDTARNQESNTTP